MQLDIQDQNEPETLDLQILSLHCFSLWNIQGTPPHPLLKKKKKSELVFKYGI